ncbi:MAG: leucine-rich repeat domain-containing protein [Bacteroidaceae bacterium]|nr:leucine-rich repeat domain-containing protein [Bacteroidaceae bacterium]
MRNFRHFYKRFLIVPLMAMSTSVCSAYDFTVNGFHFNFRETDGEVVLKATSYNTIDTLYIPPTVQFRNREFKITEIGRNAFANNKIRKLSLSEGLEEIGEGAFENNAFSVLVLPNTVESLGERAFANNPNLKTVQLGASIPASPYCRPLRYTFENCENIEKIILCTEHPIQNLYDYPPFSKMVRRFAKVYVPYNSIREYIDSGWNKLFSTLIPYLPKGQKAEPDAVIFLNWSDEKIERRESFNCSYSQFGEVETHYSKVTIESVPVNDITMLRLTFSTPILYSQTNPDIAPPISYYAIYEGQWNSTSPLPSRLQFISRPFGDHFERYYELTVDFNWFQKLQLFKSKLVPGCKFTLGRNDDSNYHASRLIYFKDTSATGNIITWPEKPGK